MCDTVVVVGDHGVWFAKNSDRAANEAQVLDWQPARHHPPGSMVRCTYLTIPQAPRTHAVLLSRPYWMWGAEMAANEHGVLIGNEAVFTRHGVPRRGLTGMDLLRLAVERAETAEAAVAVIIGLLERYPQGGGCDHENPRFSYFSSFIVADRRGAFVLETAGRHHAVERVRGARTISNGLSIPGFAERHGDPVRTWAADARSRRTRTQALAEQARDVGDLMALLRDHGEGSGPDRGAGLRYSWFNGAMRGPCMHAGGLVAASQTVASWVAHLSPETPGTRAVAGGPPGDALWVTGTAAPCTSLFKPVRVDRPLSTDPELGLGPRPTDRADADSLFWRHERLHRAVLRDPGAHLGRLAAERDAVEARWRAAPPEPEAAFAEASALLERWTAELAQAPVGNTRPTWAARYFEKRDRHAGLAPGAAPERPSPRPWVRRPPWD
ncbi:MAG TPA: carcinine hydrolase/isopenicillin-N N-acyltransferase family protein [Polyangia bacterium]|jgi:dipeptidase|nr:carcinine hydrolase/isopenicillin-N N-acyltransferase family protein [Polyangia bacterium]